MLNVAVGPDGLVKNVSVQRALSPDLDESAMSTVRTWRFEPARRDGVPVTTVVYIGINFNLQTKSALTSVAPVPASSPVPSPESVPIGAKFPGDSTPRTPPLSTEAYIAPKGLYTPEPSYTEAARRARISGEVRLQVTVGADGLVHDISVLRSLTPDLDESAMRTARTWRFEPARRNGIVVSTTIPVEIGFYLQNK
jgi:TonB family protein